MATISLLSAATAIVSELLSDTDDEDEVKSSVLVWASTTREDRIKSQYYFEVTIGNYLPDEFKRFFKVNPRTFEQICRLLAECPNLRPRGTQGRTPIPLEKKILMTLRFIASTETIHNISDRFNVTDSCFLRCKKKVIGAINRRLLNRFITWPKINDLPSIARSFNESGAYNFPNVVGAVDGTHIPIEAPQQNPNSYYNRKGFHSVVLQAVCTDDLQFIDINVGWPGRVHDAKVLKNSTLWDHAFAKCQNGRYHLLGDGAYPLKEWLLTPYRDNNHLTQQEARFNRALSSKRQVIERAFAHLKGRFRRLKYINLHKMSRVCATVTAACIVHNICIRENDEVDDMLAVDVQIANQRPQILLQQNDAQGLLKRLRITNGM